jgi:hypothetical protein
MIDTFRDCPDCGSRRVFSQFHVEPAHCPDSADRRCPEWFCSACGSGLLIGQLSGSGQLPGARELVAAGAAGPLSRVA